MEQLGQIKQNTPILLFRGDNSEFLESQIAQKMLQNKNKMELVTFQNVGHHPTLLHEQELEKILDYVKM